MNAGMDIDGHVVRIDLEVARKAHDVNEDDDNCRTCGVEYPCAMAAIVGDLLDWLDTHPQETPAPDVAGGQEDPPC